MRLRRQYTRRTATHKSEILAIRRLVNLLGGTAYVLHQGPGGGARRGLWGSAGLPDLFCTWRGRAFWVEVKVGSDRLRPAQEGFRERAERCGQTVLVGDVEVVREWVERCGRSHHKGHEGQEGQ